MERGNSEQEQKNDDALYVMKLHILLKCAGTQSWGGKFLKNKWLNIYDETAYEKIISYTNNIELENLPTFSYNKIQTAKSSEENVQNFKGRKANYCKYKRQKYTDKTYMINYTDY